MVSQRALSLLGELRKSSVNDRNALFTGQDLVLATYSHPDLRSPAWAVGVDQKS